VGKLEGAQTVKDAWADESREHDVSSPFWESSLPIGPCDLRTASAAGALS